MLSCWNEIARSRPTFADLKATFDSLLLADTKRDYIEFDPSKNIGQFQTSLEPPTSRLSASPIQKRQSFNDHEEQKLLLPNESPSGDCHLTSSSSPQFSNLSPRQQSPQQQHSRQSSTASSRQSQSCSSPKKDQSAEKLSMRHCSPTFLLPGQRSTGSLSPQNRSPFHAQGERHRPVSLLVGRDRPRDTEKSSKEDRYVKEPTKLANLNKTVNQSLSGMLENGPPQSHQLQLRRGSEGTLNMNSDGYVSFVGAAYSRDKQENPSTSTEVQITVTREL